MIGPWVTAATEDAYQPRAAVPTKGGLAVLPKGPRHYNRILDDAARRMYAPIISFLHSIAPEAMARKIEAANVQQAFVFDAVQSLSPDGAKIYVLVVSKTPHVLR